MKLPIRVINAAVLACMLTPMAWAQAPGNHLVYGLTGPTYSTAYVDASVLPGSDICAQINYALVNSIPVAGGVVDARGINAISPQFNLTCSSGTPWGGGSNTTVNRPSTVLLPSGIIQIANTWVLPSSTTVVGEGSALTTIQSLSAAVNPIIQMGSTSVCPANVCTGISLSDLTIVGSGFAVNGIVNSNAQELSYVSHVNLFQILGTGLQLLGQGSSSAKNSGPYSDINFDTQAKAATATTVCAQILSAMPTRGIHGLTCTSNGVPNAAVLVDASANSLEDVRVQGFQDGVLVGANAAAHSNVLVNIVGGKGVTNVVHISGAKGTADLSMMAINNGGAAVNTVLDDETATTLSDPAVGIYALGEPVTASGRAIGYSRFTTSTNANAVTWMVGSASIPGNTACSAKGSLFSNTNGTVGGKNTWYVCTGTGASNSWVNIQ